MRLPSVLACAWEELGLGAVLTLSVLLGLHPHFFVCGDEPTRTAEIQFLGKGGLKHGIS